MPRYFEGFTEPLLVQRFQCVGCKAVFTWSKDAASTCSWATVSGTGSTSTVAGTVGGTPTNAHVGACTVVLSAHDSAGNNTVTETVNITVNNVTPVLSVSNWSTSQGVALSFDDASVQASDEGQGAGALYDFSKVSAPDPKCFDNGVFSGEDTSTGAFTFTPDPFYTGTCNIRIAFADGHGGSVVDDIQVSIDNTNDLPVLSQSCATSVNEDSAYSCSPTSTNPDSGTLTWSKDAASTCSWATVSGTGTTGTVGACTVVLSVNDSAGNDTVIETVNITVNNVAPTHSIADASTSEDVALVVAGASVQASDEGQGAGALYSFDQAFTTAPRCSDNGALSATNTTTGGFTFTPASNYNGTCNIRVSFADGNGGSVFDEFAVTVTPVDDSPVISQSCAISVNEDSAYSCSPTATNPDNGTLTWSKDAASTCSWLTVSGTGTTGTVSGTPTNAHVGSCTLYLKVIDSEGNNSITRSMDITVNNVAPTLSIADASTSEDVALVVAGASVAASDEGQGAGALYSFDQASTTAPRCSDNGGLSATNTVCPAWAFTSRVKVPGPRG